jgi:hypothetical protein
MRPGFVASASRPVAGPGFPSSYFINNIFLVLTKLPALMV